MIGQGKHTDFFQFSASYVVSRMNRFSALYKGSHRLCPCCFYKIL
ncbi:hypothetical protein EVA_13390 [gut metagenome]|uniref:Uncharacterized protein n=1 Tax=gut metagenome TaxID=749906 RepID=J9GGK9_9ZZZZ